MRYNIAADERERYCMDFGSGLDRVGIVYILYVCNRRHEWGKVG